MAAYTGDISFNMFAAEVQFHALALYDWKGNIPGLGDYWNRSAVIADMSVGEEGESGIFDQYYDPNGTLVTKQRNKHGDF